MNVRPNARASSSPVGATTSARVSAKNSQPSSGETFNPERVRAGGTTLPRCQPLIATPTP